MENSDLIETKELVKTYRMGEHTIWALNKVNLNFKKAEFAGLVGPSGSGKTTLLNIVGSLDSPTEGSAVVLGKKVEELTHKEAAALRNLNIGFIFQTFNLLPVYTVFENVEFPLLLHDLTSEERKKMTMDALEWVGLADRAKSKPAQLSGGQSQRGTQTMTTRRPTAQTAGNPSPDGPAARASQLDLRDGVSSRNASHPPSECHSVALKRPGAAGVRARRGPGGREAKPAPHDRGARYGRRLRR